MRRIISLYLIAVFVTSCASSKRLGRFYSEKSLASEKKAEQANMFPLYYESGDATSVLWPLIDKGDHGFAFRPFYNQEDNEYAVLFPLSAWNSVQGDGWIGPNMWSDDYRFLFPFYYGDEDSDHSAGLYSLHKSGNKSEHSVLFKLLCKWTDYKNGEYSHYLFPWYSKKTKEVEQELLFPFHYGRRTKKGSITVNPLYWFSESEKQKYGREEYDREGGLVETSWGTPPLLPLLSRKESKHRKITKSLCGLLYNNTAKGNEISGSVLGFIAGWESDAESSSFRIPSIFNMTGLVDFAKTEDISKVNLLLYSHEKSPEVTRRDIFPFMTWDSGKNESGFSYLFFHGELNRRS